MKEDRDELVLRVFPQLRKLCDRSALERGEVDLRWGIIVKTIQRPSLERSSVGISPLGPA